MASPHIAGSHCRELGSLRSDLDQLFSQIEELKASFRADMERLQQQLDQERLERRLWQNRVDAERMVGV